MSICKDGWIKLDVVGWTESNAVGWSRMESDRVLVIEMSASQHATLFVYGVHCTLYTRKCTAGHHVLLQELLSCCILTAVVGNAQANHLTVTALLPHVEGPGYNLRTWHLG
jgi:hypothetical protein